MSDLKIIKQKILNENRLQDIYEAMGCEFISYSGNRIEAQLPEKFNSKNRRATQTKLNENLTSSIRNVGDFEGGDIYALVSYVVHDKRGEDIAKDLYEAKRFICETLGWNNFLNNTFRTKKDYVAPLRALVGNDRNKKEITPNEELPEDIMDEYMPYLSHGWYEEGIPLNIQRLYDVRFDLESKRIVYPIRNRFGKIVGVKGRLISEEDEQYEPKYIYLHKCNISLEWFNLHFAIPYILKEKKVIIVEAEKSVMKLVANGIHNVLAISSSEISMVQVDIIKQLGLDIEIILCYDKGIGIDEIKKQAEKFKGRNVYAMYDTDSLLEDKMAPIDDGIETFNKLYDEFIFPIAN